MAFALVLLAVCAVPFARRGDLLEPVKVFALLFAMSMGVRGIINLYQESIWISSYGLGSAEYKHKMSLVFIYSIIAMLALYLGYYSKLGGAIAARLPNFSFLSKKRGKMAVAAVFAVIISGLSTYIFFKKVGGLETLGDPHAVITSGIEEGGRLFYSLFMDFSAVGFVLLYAYTAGRRRILIEKTLLLALLLLIFAQFLIVGMKGYLVGFSVMMVVSYHYLKERLSAKKALLALLLVLLLLPLFDNYKRFGLSAGMMFGEYAPLDVGHTASLTLTRSAGADMFFQGIDKTPSLYPFQYGRTLLRVFTSFVPRPFWPEKPWSFGIDFNRDYLELPEFMAAVSPSTIGELYINFHVMGIVAGFFLIGCFLRCLYGYCINGATSREKVVLYAIVMERMIVLVDGPIGDFTTFVLIKLFPFAALGGILKLMDGKRSVGHGG